MTESKSLVALGISRWKSRRGGLQRDMRKFGGMIDMFIVLIVELISRVYINRAIYVYQLYINKTVKNNFKAIKLSLIAFSLKNLHVYPSNTNIHFCWTIFIKLLIIITLNGPLTVPYMPFIPASRSMLKFSLSKNSSPSWFLGLIINILLKT